MESNEIIEKLEDIDSMAEDIIAILQNETALGEWSMAYDYLDKIRENVENLKKIQANPTTETPDWIYQQIIPNEEFYKKIELALGYKLFHWQKTFIESGHFRKAGITTAKILRELLDINAPAINIPITYVRGSNAERAYINNLIDIKTKLSKAEIQTRKVIIDNIVI